MSVLKFIRKSAIFAVFIGLFVVGSICLSQSVGAISNLTSTNVGELFSLSNQERAEIGLTSLNLNEQLNSAARSKANHMLANNYWAHYAPDGTTPWSFITNTGYYYSSAGENLAKGFTTSDGVVQGWMASSTHKDNVLGAYTDVGYAVVDGTLLGSETTLVVAMYGIRAQSVVAPVSEATAPVQVPITTPDPTPAVISTPVPNEPTTAGSTTPAPISTTTTPPIETKVATAVPLAAVESKEPIVTNQTDYSDIIMASVLAVSLILIFVAIRRFIPLHQRPISVILNN